MSSLVLSPGAGFAQNLDELIEALDRNRLDEIRALLPSVEARYPGHPTVLFLKGLLTEDADLAFGYYEELLKKHPESRFAPDALYRICQYYFAKGLYTTCRTRCQRLLRTWPHSPKADEAEYLLASSFFASGQFDSAYVRLRRFLIDYPNSPLIPLVRDDLSSFQDRSLRVGPGGQSRERLSGWPQSREQGGRSTQHGEPQENREETAVFVVQVGAFRSKANALRQEQILAQRGYLVRVEERERRGAKFHVVWVGQFRTYAEAQEFGRELSRRLGLPFQVVNTGEKP